MVRTDRLVIPHPLAHHRAFVLRPLADIDPQLVIPNIGVSVSDLLRDLPQSETVRVIPIGDSIWRLGSHTYIMGIVIIIRGSS